MRRHHGRRGGARNVQPAPTKLARVNGEIRASEVLVIDASGEQAGVLAIANALALAEAAQLDLVEVAPAASPPVCRIVDFGKFRYDVERKQKLARRNQKTVSVKEVRLRPKIGVHDLSWKLDQLRGFLDEGAKVKVIVFFRGREREHPQRGRDLLLQIAETVADRGAVEQAPLLDGRTMSMTIAAKVKADA